MKRVVILQPGYLPWLGFFDQLYKADVFVVLDDVQYTVRDWRSRNRIKAPNGVMWLTVPVRSKNSRDKQIKEIEIDNQQHWQEKHLRSIEFSYGRARYFKEVIELILDIYRKKYEFLIHVDMDFIFQVCEYLSIDTRIIYSSEIPSTCQKDEKLLSICKFLNATHYLSGNAAKDYLRESTFESDGITLEWHSYQHPYYDQHWVAKTGFISHLSILDLLFNHGPESLDILLGKKVIPSPQGAKIRYANEIL